MDKLDYSPVRIALKFSLWAWAFYWPGGGLMLLFGGLDVLSVVVTLLSLGTFLSMMFFGQLDAEDSKSRWQFFLERPLYLVLLFFGMMAIVPIIGVLASIGIAVYGVILLGGCTYLIVTLVRFDRAHEGRAYDHKTDQLYIAAGIAWVSSFIIVVDGLMYAAGAPLIESAVGVAVVNWGGILYPVTAFAASRGIQSPLRRPQRARKPVNAVEPNPIE
jgi:hypothetical protein